MDTNKTPATETAQKAKRQLSKGVKLVAFNL